MVSGAFFRAVIILSFLPCKQETMDIPVCKLANLMASSQTSPQCLPAAIVESASSRPHTPKYQKMKSPSLLTSALIVGIIALTPLHADEAAVAGKLAKIPPAAAEALKKAAGTAKIEKVNIEKDGKTTVYEAELVEAGQPNREVSVTADGKI